MLLALAQWLQNDVSFLRVFTYLTFRAVGATITALFVGLICGPWVIRKLTHRVSVATPFGPKSPARA